MHRSSWTPSIVPSGWDQSVYLVVDCDRHGACVWTEAYVESTDLETVIADLMSGQYSDGSRPLPSFAVRRKLEPSVPQYYGVTHAHFVVAFGNPFASNSSRYCEQKSTSRPSVWSFVVESESVPK
ncbi:MAG: hypothetical protein JWR49_3825 [Tardiphaga sp.]|nr:hypothetical protein [Tardiphaga sp.]